MTRAERRLGKVKEPTYTLTQSQINQIKKDATDAAIEKAMLLTLGLPVMVIHDKFPKLIKVTESGKGRAERFADLLLDLWDSFEKEYITLDDVKQCLYDECGFTIEEEKVKTIYSK